MGSMGSLTLRRTSPPHFTAGPARPGYHAAFPRRLVIITPSNISMVRDEGDAEGRHAPHHDSACAQTFRRPLAYDGVFRRCSGEMAQLFSGFLDAGKEALDILHTPSRAER